MVAELAKAGGQRPLRFEQETPGGYTLEQHWKAGKALTQIRHQPVGCVVVQNRGPAPLLNSKSMREYARKFNAEISHTGSRTILYMTWAPPTRNRADRPAIGTVYERLSKEMNAKLFPQVGNAWRAALTADRRLVLHDADQGADSEFHRHVPGGVRLLRHDLRPESRGAAWRNGRLDGRGSSTAANHRLENCASSQDGAVACKSCRQVRNKRG